MKELSAEVEEELSTMMVGVRMLLEPLGNASMELAYGLLCKVSNTDCVQASMVGWGGNLNIFAYLYLPLSLSSLPPSPPFLSLPPYLSPPPSSLLPPSFVYRGLTGVPEALKHWSHEKYEC